MWVLIKVNKLRDIGLNEERRVLIEDDEKVERNVLPPLIEEDVAKYIPPAIGGISSSDLLRKMIG